MTLDPNAQEMDFSQTNVQNTEVMGMTPNTFCMLLHLSQLSNFLVPLAGYVVPIVMWAIGKDKSPLVDQHGKVVLNWLISEFIYLLVSGLLCIVLIGFVILPVVIILGIVFPIIGAVKANDGTVWKYPLSIPFFK